MFRPLRNFVMKKMKLNRKLIAFGLIAAFAVFGLACQKQSADVTVDTSNTTGTNTAAVNTAVENTSAVNSAPAKPEAES